MFIFWTLFPHFTLRRFVKKFAALLISTLILTVGGFLTRRSRKASGWPALIRLWSLSLMATAVVRKLHTTNTAKLLILSSQGRKLNGHHRYKSLSIDSFFISLVTRLLSGRQKIVVHTAALKPACFWNPIPVGDSHELTGKEERSYATPDVCLRVRDVTTRHER